jgi:hypothetical protein
MLPAFVDCERADGSIAAIRAYPHIWWHLWACRDCLGAYDLASGSGAARQPGKHEAAASRAPATGHKAPPLLHLSRQYLAIAIPAPATMRGGEEGPLLVAESSAEGSRQATLVVEERRDSSWAVTVTAVPAPAGGLLLMLGAVEFRAPFDETGTAVVVGVPAALLGGADGPDLVVGIEAGE